MQFRDRLTETMNRMGVSQAALAEHLEVSAASVSSWCSGAKQPQVDRLAAMAEFLSVSPGYLQFGEGARPRLDERVLQPLREKYRSELEWYWRPAPRDRGREFGNAAAYAFETDIATLARESAQNISDERLSTAPSVQARYTVSELSGRHLADFLDAIKFDAIRPHLESARTTNRKAGSVIDRGLEELDDDRLVLIRIDDFDANGLTGPEFDKGRFMAVVRNTLDSQKSEAAGGSFGLGWATLPASSQFGLVLCNSNLSVAEDGLSRNRFIGVVDLPWHSFGEQEFAGRGWYGLPDPNDDWNGPKRTISNWDNDALCVDTLLARPDSRPGSSFLIVGAYDASGAVEGVEQIAERLSESLADNFWPAMVAAIDGQAPLQVSVKAERNGSTVLEQFVVPSRYQPAKVAAFAKHLRDDVVESLDEAGDVVQTHVSLQVPKRVAVPTHGSHEHDAVLIVAQADDDGSGRRAEEAGYVTFLRGSGMVISTTRLSALPIGARPFHAIVLAGDAAGDAVADHAADRFLRAAEPPAHNKWTGTPEITSSYTRGGKAAIDRFSTGVMKNIREIIRQPSKDLSDGPEALRELLRIVPPQRAGKRPRVKSVRSHSIDEAGAWVITEATVTLPARPDGRGWTLSPVLKFGTQSGAPIPVRWSSIDAVAHCEVDEDGRIITPPDERTATFTAVTDPTTHPVGARRAKVLVDVRVHTDEVER